MPRRRKDDFWIQPIAGIVSLFVFLGFVDSTFRNFILATCFWLVSFVAIFGIGFLAYKILKKKHTVQDNIPFASVKKAHPPLTDVEKYGPKPARYEFESYASKPEPIVLPADFVPAPEPELKPVDRLRTIDWYQFEKLVAHMYENRGFEVIRKGGANPDGGIDLIVIKNGQKSGVQCKQWKSWNVGVKAVREFLGALTDAQIQTGIFVTLNGYTNEAKLLAEKHSIEIINETDLRSMLEGLDLHGPEITEIFNDTRKICPKCESVMILRTAGKGSNPGQQFWGCSGFPRCRFTMPC